MIQPSFGNRTLPDGRPWPHPFGFTIMPDLPPSTPRRGGRLARRVGRTVLRILRWRLVGPYPDVPRLVIAGGPHTSNWDGIVGLAAILALDIDVRVLAKHTLFRGPTGRVLRWLRAVPVDRSRPGGFTERLAARFVREDRFILGVTPEGTRRKVPAWKTGWYRIAERARVPILPVALDFGAREIRLGIAFFPSGDMEADFDSMRAFLATAMARNPERA